MPPSKSGKLIPEEFFSKDEGGFVTVTADTPFYINEKGNPVVVFEKYEIAPGFMGRPEFEIEREVDKSGLSEDTLDIQGLS